MLFDAKNLEGDPDGTRSRLRLEFPLDEPTLP
jgi:hypothetical protein